MPASQGVVTSTLLQNRPTLRPGEVLEFVPGVIVTQHSGDGKANQAVNKVVALGATVTRYGRWFGQFQLRYFGPRPLVEDGSQPSASTMAYLRVG